jgi:D-glycero-D-manno-heptose 1,7-bisphosphate phosphatase
MRRPCVFLDRDGTLNARPAEHEYLTGPDQFAWLPGAIAGIVRIAEAGYAVTVVSNQRGVGLGVVAPAVLEVVEARIQRDLAGYDCAIEAFRYCTHLEEDRCECRKPRPGMILALAEELGLDLERSWVIGDSLTDIRAGVAAGCRSVLLGAATWSSDALWIAPSLDVAADLVVRTDAGQSRDLFAAPSNSATSA